MTVQSSARLDALYDRVLNETGNERTAAGARSAAKNAAEAYFDEMVIKFGGDTHRARAQMEKAYDHIESIVLLMPAASNGDTSAIRDALGKLGDLGIEPSKTFGWLDRNIKDDSVLRAAGLDPKEVRRPNDSFWSFVEPDELLELAHSVLKQYRRSDGTSLTPAEIEKWMQSAQSSAEKYGVGRGLDWQQRYEPDAESKAVSVQVLADRLRV